MRLVGVKYNLIGVVNWLILWLLYFIDCLFGVFELVLFFFEDYLLIMKL